MDPINIWIVMMVIFSLLSITGLLLVIVTAIERHRHPERDLPKRHGGKLLLIGLLGLLVGGGICLALLMNLSGAH